MRSQADCYRALLDGKTLTHKDGGIEVRFVNEKLVHKDGKTVMKACAFSKFEDWSIKEEPKRLYAYKDQEHGAVYFKEQCLDIPNRRPEYDLEYPNE